MANSEHLERLQQGAEVWNRWREKDPGIIPDLSEANLSGFNLSKFFLSRVNLSRANLSRANLYDVDLSKSILSHADLSQASLSEADLSEANLYRADLSRASLDLANLYQTRFPEANLYQANLHRAFLTRAFMVGANMNKAILIGSTLVEVNLSRTSLAETILRHTHVLGANFERAIFTGACIEDWNINGATNFEGAICDYIYLKIHQQERRPREGNFKPGEFAALFQQAVDTIDLIFKDGIDWQAFFQSFQDLRRQYADQDLSIQAIEKKRGGAFIVRLEVAEGADKSAIESSAKELYETKLALIEQRYRDVLQAKEGEIIAYKEQSTNLMKITELLGSKLMPPEINQTFNAPVGNVAGTNQGRQQTVQHNYAAAETPSLAEAAAEIQTLLKQLEASNPTATEADQTAFLNIMIPPTKRERFIGALKAAGGAAIEEVPYGAVLKALVEGWQKPGE